MSRHLIHRQILDLSYKDESRARKAMNQWSDRFQKDWLPILEEALDELDSDGKWIRLDKVEIDLGTIRENYSPELLRQKLKEALKNQLLRQLPNVDFSSKTQEFPHAGLTKDEKKPLELLDFLLRNGRKPWWGSHSKKEGIRSLILKLLAEKPRKFFDWLRSEPFSRAMLIRLENHLKKSEIQQLISFAFPDQFKEFSLLKESLGLALSPEVIQKAKLQQQLETAFSEAVFLSEGNLVSPHSKWIKSHSIKANSSKITLETYSEILAALIPFGFRDSSKIETLEKVWIKWTKTSVFKKSVQNPPTESKQLKIGQTKFLELVKKGLSKNQFSEKESSLKVSQTFTQEKLGMDETFPISNAGLVLVAPFLPFFFKGLGLVENKQFVSQESQNRAVLLIQALLDDAYAYEESDLLLNKILCGIEPSEPIAVSFSPTELEKEEIKNLLEAMVSNWTALKSTSGSSLAKGFFPREGSLKRFDKGYHLTVPRISIDILLNRLPWTISIIKLPWMNDPLFTEW